MTPATIPQLRPYQEQAVEQIRQLVREGMRNILLCAPTGAGKCLGYDTPVLMFDGSIKPVQNIKTGDLLMGPDSNPRTVLSTTWGVGPLYRVTPTKGDPYVVNDAHILSLKMTRGGAKYDCSRSDQYAPGKIHNISVTEYLAKSRTFRHCAKGWRTGVAFAPQQPLPLDPYFLGIWLGDGDTNRPNICTPDDEILACVRDVAQAHGLSVRIARQEGSAAVMAHIHGEKRGAIHDNVVLDKLRALGVAGNKHIPHLYLTASRQDRLALLAGLLDTDGHMSNGGFDFVQKSERLAKEVMYLARSLGFAAYGGKVTKRCCNTGSDGWYWRIYISGHCNQIPTRIARKQAAARTIKKDPLLVGLSVEPIGEGKYYGFEIDGDRLFMLGDFTVTHNTIMASYLIAASLAKGSRSAFVVDRLSLVNQTSETLDSLGVDHGVMQANHWRFRPGRKVQVCSVQTLARRQWPDADLIIVDECHTLNKTVTDRISQRDVVTIGLTATPFTRGLGKIYDAMVNVTTTNRLMDQGFLSKYRIFAASEPDMTGVRVVAGEWEGKETSKRAMQVVGDCVAEYLKHGQGKKFICSAADIAHARELHRQFMAAGVVCSLYTSKELNSERDLVVQEFRKPESSIRGLVTVVAASKGFDVPDIGVVIMARPLRNSLAEHIQFLGRGLRTAKGKEECLVLDHSGNCLRFWEDMNDFFEVGVQALDDGRKKPKEKRRAKDTKERVRKCPSCKHLHKPMPYCPQCGHEYPKRTAVTHVNGTLKELIAGGERKALSAVLWPQIVHWAIDRHGVNEAGRKRALAVYRDMTGQWPSGDFYRTEPIPPTAEVKKKISAQSYAWHKRTQWQKNAMTPAQRYNEASAADLLPWEGPVHPALQGVQMNQAGAPAWK